MTDTVAEYTKTDTEMTKTKKNNINEALHQKLRKNDVYETDIHEIDNLIVSHTNEQLY